MFKTNKKSIGLILIIFGTYLLVGNTLFSLLFNFPGPIGWGIPINPSDYWRNWWNNNGLATVIIAVAGLLLLIQGIRILIRSNKSTVQITESH